MGVVFALSAALAYGVGDFLASYFGRRHAPIELAVVSLGAAGVLMLVVGSAVPSDLIAGDFPWIVVAGVANGAGTGALFWGLAYGRVSVVAPLSGVVACVVPCGEAVLFGVPLRATTIAGLVLGTLSIALIGGGLRIRPGDVGSTLAGVLAGLGFGFAWLALSHFSRASGTWSVGLEFLLSSLVLFVGVNLFVGPGRNVSVRQAFRRLLTGPAWLIGLLSASASGTFVVSTGYEHVSLSAVIAALYPGITVLLGWYFYKEVVFRTQKAGLALGVIAICLLVVSP